MQLNVTSVIAGMQLLTFEYEARIRSYEDHLLRRLIEESVSPRSAADVAASK